MTRSLSRLSALALAILAVGACKRKDNNPLVGTPGGGVTGVNLAVRGVDNTQFPDIKVLLQPRTSGGAAITDLTVGNFQILQGGKAGPIPAAYGSASGYPFSVMLVMDHSGSMAIDDGTGSTRLALAQQAAAAFLNALGADDQAAYIEFDDSVNFVQGFTSDKSVVIAAVNASTPAGATACYDGIVKGAEELSKGTGLRLLVFLTDGDDNSSTNSPAMAQEKLATAGVIACGIVVGGDIADTTVLDGIATSTGGQLLSGTTALELQTAFNTILTSGLFDDIYALSFRSKNSQGSATYSIYINYGSFTDRADLVDFL